MNGERTRVLIDLLHACALTPIIEECELSVLFSFLQITFFNFLRFRYRPISASFTYIYVCVPVIVFHSFVL